MPRSHRIVVAAAGGSLVLTLAAAWILVSPALEAGPIDRADALFAAASGSAVGAATAPSSPAVVGTIVVDVQGGVVAPGVRELAAGARVGDAIAAAGGYGPDADLDAAARTLNLASPLTDGAQVRVPRIGEAVAAAPTGATGGGGGATAAGGDVIDLNTATPEELEALPGIGQVTVQKIVAARQEAPFSSLEDALERGVLNRGQLEDIQGLATAG